MLELSGGADPVAETGTSTENNNTTTTTHTCGTVTPATSPLTFLAVGYFANDAGSWTEDADFVNKLAPGAPSYFTIARRFQSDLTAQSYSGTSGNSVSSSFALAAIVGASGGPVLIPFRTVIGAKRI